MTTLTTVFGIMPIALGLGAGAESRRPMGVAVVGGLVVSMAHTLVVVPVVYTLLARWAGAPKRVEAEEAVPAEAISVAAAAPGAAGGAAG
jgi:hypothetical protein